MKTLSELVHSDPKKLEKLLIDDPLIGDSILIGSFSCSFEDQNGLTVRLKKHYFMFTRFFHLNLESQAECFIYEKYKARRIIKLTIHKK